MPTIDLLPSEILLLEDWNSRQSTVVEGEATELSDTLTDEQLETSIEQDGVLQPPKVRQVVVEDTPRWAAVMGFRRVRAARKVRPDEALSCIIMAPKEGEDEESTALIQNLSENLHRQSLKAWEVSEALCRIQDHTGLSTVELGRRTGLSQAYVSRLMLIKRKAHPSIWAQFKKWGATLKVPGIEMVRVVRLPQEEQLIAWKEALERRANTASKRGKAMRPGVTKLRRYLHKVPLMSRKSKDWQRGAAYAFKVALGLKTFK